MDNKKTKYESMIRWYITKEYPQIKKHYWEKWLSTVIAVDLWTTLGLEKQLPEAVKALMIQNNMALYKLYSENVEVAIDIITKKLSEMKLPEGFHPLPDELYNQLSNENIWKFIYENHIDVETLYSILKLKKIRDKWESVWKCPFSAEIKKMIKETIK